MKPIILKAVTGSIFLLVVASALYFFAQTIFVNQSSTKAAGVDWQGGVNALWGQVPAFNDYPEATQKWYPWSQNGPTAVWESHVASRVYICNKHICWTLIRNGTTVAWDGSAWDMRSNPQFTDNLKAGLNGTNEVFLWSNGGPTAVWTWKVKNWNSKVTPQAPFFNDGQPLVQETLYCNGNICWAGERSMAPGNNSFMWKDNGNPIDLPNYNSFWSEPVPSIYGGQVDGIWQHKGITATWDDPVLGETTLCNHPYSTGPGLCLILQHPKENSIDRWAWKEFFTSMTTKFPGLNPYVKNGNAISLDATITSAWTSPVTNLRYTCNGSVCWIYNLNTSTWENGGNAIDLSLAESHITPSPSPVVTGTPDGPGTVAPEASWTDEGTTPTSDDRLDFIEKNRVTCSDTDWENVYVYNSDTSEFIGKMKDYSILQLDGAPMPKCNSVSWPEGAPVYAYYRFWGTKEQLKASGLPQKIKLKMYSDGQFSNIVDLGTSPGDPQATVTVTPTITTTPNITTTITPTITITPTTAPDITLTPTPTIPASGHDGGDANEDGEIDQADYEIWEREFIGQAGSGEGGVYLADFNNNNKVNLSDLYIWIRNSQ